MQIHASGKKAREDWVKKLIRCLWKRAKKETKYYKNKPPKPTAWEIIHKLVA